MEYESVARPAPDLSEDRHKAITVATMYSAHLGVITLEQIAGLGEALTNGQVLAGQVLEYVGRSDRSTIRT